MRLPSPLHCTLLLLCAFLIACPGQSPEPDPDPIEDAGAPPDAGEGDADGGEAEGDGGEPFDAGTRLIITSRAPANAATAVRLDVAVHATFDLAVDPATVSGATFSLNSSTAEITGVVSFDETSRTAIFTPTELLPPDELLTATVTTGVQSRNGLKLPTNEVWSFTTQALVPTDTTAPSVIATTPDAGATQVAGSSITATFSEDMQPGSFGSASMTVTRLSVPNRAVKGAVTYDATTRTATFTPAVPLQGSSRYEVTVDNGVRDVAGNGLTAPLRFDFTTEAEVTAPSVLSTSPGTGAVDVSSLTAAVRITFSEAINPDTLCDGGVSFTSYVDAGFDNAPVLEDGGFDAGVAVPLPGVVTWDDRSRTAGFVPSAAFERGALITGTVAQTVADQAGNRLSAPWTFSFTVESTVDAPHVVSTMPPQSARLVPRSGVIKVTFDRDVDPATVNATNLSLSTQPATVSYDAVTRTATLSPPVFFPAASEVTVTVRDVQDNAGVAMARPYSFGFRTLGDPVKLSVDSLPDVLQFSAAAAADEVMAAWVTESGSSRRAQWALRKGSTWTGGRFTQGGVANSPTLYVAGTRFGAAHDFNLLYPAFIVFNGSTWTETTGYLKGVIGVAGDSFVNITSNGPLDAYALPAGETAWQGPVPVANQGDALRVATAGALFGVTYRVPTAVGGCRLAFRRYDGTTWSFESTIATRTEACSAVETRITSNDKTFAVSYAASSNAYVSVYDVTSDAWTAKNLGASSAGAAVSLGGAGTGFVAFVRTATGLSATTWDGTAWATAVSADTEAGAVPARVIGGAAGYLAVRTLASNALSAVVVSNGAANVTTLKVTAAGSTPKLLSAIARSNGFAVTYEVEGNTFLRAYENGAWSGERRLNITGESREAVLVNAASSSVLVSVDHGALRGRTYFGGTALSSNVEPLPQGLMRGSSGAVSHARNSAGQMLVTWTQFDVGVLRCFTRYFDGTNWSTPVRLPVRVAQLPMAERCVALTNDRAFSIAWIAEAAQGGQFVVYASRWSANSGLGTPMRVSSESQQASELRAENDGEHLRLVWSSNTTTRGAGSVLSASSVDGLSWSAPQTVVAQTTIRYEPVNFATSRAGSLISTYGYGTTVSKLSTFSGETQNLVSGAAPVAAGPWRLAALDVSGATSNLLLSSGGAFTSTPIGVTSANPPQSALAVFGDEFRIIVGGKTFVTSGEALVREGSVERWTNGDASMKCDVAGCAMFGRQDPNYTELSTRYTSGNALVFQGNVIPNAKGPDVSYVSGRYGVHYLVRDNSKDADEAFWIFE